MIAERGSHASDVPVNLPPAHPVEPNRGLFRRLAQKSPTAIALIGLSVFAIAGHQSGWKLPKVSALMGKAPAAKEAWCEEHGVSEADCVECNSDLLPKGKNFGWCSTHGVHNCPLDHPEVAQLKRRTEVSEADLERARRALELLPRAENEKKCTLHNRRIQFPDQVAAERAGLDVLPVTRRPIIESVPANGEILYDPSRVARISSRASGTVWRVFKQVGEPVEEGEILALVDAAEVGKAKSDFLQALALVDLRAKTVERQRSLAGTGAVTIEARQEAEAALNEAQIRVLGTQQFLVNLGLPVRPEEVKGKEPAEAARYMQFLGLPAELKKGLDPLTAPANLLPLRAPRAGTVTLREVVPGEVVDPAKVLFVVADPTRMWLSLDVRLEDIGAVDLLRRKVVFTPHGGKNNIVGEVNWVSTAVDGKTRTVKARAELENKDGRLRANTFGAGQVVLREEPEAIVIPNAALHWEGDCFIVFVRDKNYLAEGAYKVFHTRTVRPGVSDGKRTEIIAGVLPGEVVASEGSGVLLAELLRGNLGEG